MNPEVILRRVRSRNVGLGLDALFACDARLRADTFEIGPAVRGDIPCLIRLIETRKMPVPVPLKFARTPALLEATWPHVHWIVARRQGRLVGCIELRPVEGEPDAWEIGSFSQAADNRNARMPVKLWAAAFRKLVVLRARAAVVEIHNDNDAMWAFLAHLPFQTDSEPCSHPSFTRYRMAMPSPSPVK